MAEQYVKQPVNPTEKDQKADDPLEKILRRIRRNKEFPSISQYVVEINQKLSENANQSSASELANIILKDYALTNKLLKLVNSAFYGFAAGNVSTVTRAVVLLGYDNVRLAAVSLLLFEHFKGNSETRDLKETTISSFWCGLIAKEITKTRAGENPEEAFVCAMLHQLGKLLVIYHMPKDYRKIKNRMAGKGENEAQAVNRVLGVSYDAIGMAVAKQWNLPDSLQQTMVPLSHDALADKKQRIDSLSVTANFANELRLIVTSVPQKKKSKAIDKLLEDYSNHVAISEKELSSVMRASLENLCKHSDALQFSAEKSLFLQCLAGEKIDPASAGDKNTAKPVADSHQAMDTSLRLPDSQERDVPSGDDTVGIIMGGIQEMSSAMMGEYDVNNIALMSLEILYRAMQFQRVILFIHEGRKKSMVARYGYGAGVEDLIGRIAFAATPGPEPDLFSHALQREKDLIVDDLRASAFNPLIPHWYKRSLDARAFIFMPITFQKICIGAYYADSDRIGPPVNAEEHQYLSMLRNQLVLGIKMARN